MMKQGTDAALSLPEKELQELRRISRPESPGPACRCLELYYVSIRKALSRLFKPPHLSGWWRYLRGPQRQRPAWLCQYRPALQPDDVDSSKRRTWTYQNKTKTIKSLGKIHLCRSSHATVFIQWCRKCPRCLKRSSR